jgi:hypothetical protein
MSSPPAALPVDPEICEAIRAMDGSDAIIRGGQLADGYEIPP